MGFLRPSSSSSSSSSTSGVVFQLASGSAVSATTIDVGVTPPAGMNSRSTLLAIDTGGLTCELRQVSSISGTVITLDRALTYAHSANATVVWCVADIAPYGFWGAVGNNTTDDTAAIQAANDQSAAVANTSNGIAWLDGTGCRFLITRPIMFVNGTRVKTVGKFKASSGTWGTWGAVAESTNALGMSCQDMPVDITANPATDTITCSSSPGTAVGNKVVVIGAGLPAPLISGRVYFVKTLAGNDLTLALTSGGATIDITTAGSGTMKLYPDVNALERVYFDDVYFDGGAVANLNGFLYGTQQPGEWGKVRLDNMPGFGLSVLGQIHHFTNLEFVVCGRGLVLPGTASGMEFYTINFANCTVSSISFEGGSNNGLFGVWCERSPIGVDMLGLSGGNILDQILFSMTNTTDPCVKVHVGAANSSGWEMRGSKFNNSAQLVINDVDHGFDLTATQIDQHQLSLIRYAQPSGPVAPIIDNNSVRSVSANYTATLADEVILVDATGGAITVTLPTANSIKGKRYTIIKTDASANAVTVSGTINGAASASLAAQYNKTTVVSQGTVTGYYVIA